MGRKGKGKKPFIDKQSATNFTLGYRSQRDPLIAAANEIGERVFMPFGNVQQRKAEQSKYGIDYDDDYDYLQHLRAPEDFGVGGELVQTPKQKTLKVPQAAVASSRELDESVINSGLTDGPPQDLDPEIIAALEGHFDFDDPDNELEDDFFELAGGEMVEDEGPDVTNYRDDFDRYEDESSEDESSEENEDTDGALSSDEEDLLARDREGRKGSRFTQYSLTSSVMRRSEGLKLLDAQFETMYEQYDEEQLADLPLEEGEDLAEECLEPNSERITDLADEFHEHREQAKDFTRKLIEEDKAPVRDIDLGDSSEGEGDLLHSIMVPKDRDLDHDKWDCESVLTTYSNLYNHPQLIKEESNPRKSKRRIEIDVKGMPKGVLPERLSSYKLRKLNQLGDCTDDVIMEEDNQSVRSVASTFRPKNESPEERRIRKQAVKAERQQRRIDKKANKQAFKEEDFNQRKQNLANRPDKGTLKMR